MEQAEGQELAEQLNADLPQEQEQAPVLQESESPPLEVAEAETATDSEYVEASADEARKNNYVPYDRFREVIEARKAAEARVREQENLFAHYRQQSLQPQPVAQEDSYSYDEDDPLEIARAAVKRAADLEQKLEAKEQAANVRSEIQRHVTNLGFRDQGRASQQIQRDIVYALQTTGQLPDLETVARDLRQSEIEYEKNIISEYTQRKRSPDARAASQRPSSPPVVDAPAPKATGWGNATSSVLDRLKGNR